MCPTCQLHTLIWSELLSLASSTGQGDPISSTSSQYLRRQKSQIIFSICKTTFRCTFLETSTIICISNYMCYLGMLIYVCACVCLYVCMHWHTNVHVNIYMHVPVYWCPSLCVKISSLDHVHMWLYARKYHTSQEAFHVFCFQCRKWLNINWDSMNSGIYSSTAHFSSFLMFGFNQVMHIISGWTWGEEFAAHGFGKA